MGPDFLIDSLVHTKGQTCYETSPHLPNCEYFQISEVKLLSWYMISTYVWMFKVQTSHIRLLKFVIYFNALPWYEIDVHTIPCYKCCKNETEISKILIKNQIFIKLWYNTSSMGHMTCVKWQLQYYFTVPFLPLYKQGCDKVKSKVG